MWGVCLGFWKGGNPDYRNFSQRYRHGSLCELNWPQLSPISAKLVVQTDDSRTTTARRATGLRDGLMTTIRRATWQDLKALVALEAIFPIGDRIAPASWRRFIAKPGCVWVATTETDLLGAAVVLFRQGTRSARLYSLAAAPAARGSGLGAGLLEACETEALRRGCTCLRLEVRPDNSGAVALYEKQGFRSIGRKPAYYTDGTDALHMEKLLLMTGSVQ